MAVPELKEQNIIDALKYIDEHGYPKQRESSKYLLVTEDGKEYPPRYVLALASHLAYGKEISTKDIVPSKASQLLEKLGFRIEEHTEQNFVLTITADSVKSNDKRFTLDNLALGNNYKPQDVYFERTNGNKIRRSKNKGEREISNQTMPRLACQVFEKDLTELSVEDKKNFPICQYSSNKPMFKGIYANVDEFQKQCRHTLEYLTYNCADGKQFVFYCWNIFSTVIFIQECLKRFGKPGDKFVMKYREKDLKDRENVTDQKEPVQYLNPFSEVLIESKNLIFRGAPGTGKSYLAKEIAADIITKGTSSNFEDLTAEEKKQVEFVQFHPNYDYSDFVEGLRPRINDDGSMGFELQDGVFKKFIALARKNDEDSQKSIERIEKEVSVQQAISEFFSGVEFGIDTFKTTNGSEFSITNADDSHVYISIPGNAIANRLVLNLDEVRKMLESELEFKKVKDLAPFFGKSFTTQAYSYEFVIYKAIRERKRKPLKVKHQQQERKNYVFIIDEINRGEISKIFGELFFAIDPGYRGKAGEIATQYSNLHSDPNEKFYIPDNVYIIGTMNDIDRSVDSFDFAMRRRFRFIELKADTRREEILASLDDALKSEAIRRMDALNKEIAAVEDLNENYQIGPSYFLKLKTLGHERLWTDYLQPLLQEYIHGMYDEQALMNRFAKAYGYKKTTQGDADGATQD